MSIFRKRRIFLDYFGGHDNPSGIHEEGRIAKERLLSARLRLSKVLRCQTKDIVFTSGGTEADNLAILGVFEGSRQEFAKPHIVISKGEHPAVLESALEAERRGAELDIVSSEEIVSKIKNNTILVSVVYAESETGRINPVSKIGRHIRSERNKKGSKYPYFHTDATGALGLLDIDIDKVPGDLITLDRVLVVRPDVSIKPIIFGGGQERGLRSGTEDVSSIERFIKDFEIALKNKDQNFKKLERLKKIFISELQRFLPDVLINTPEISLPNVVSITFPKMLHEFLAIKLDLNGVSVSTGSSCDANKNEDDKEALRFSFSPKTKEREIKEAVRILKSVVLE